MVFIVLIVIAAALFYPYIATAVKCKKMLTKLERIAKREAYNLIPLRRFPWLMKNFSGKYDFLLEGRGNVWAVKLVSCVHKNSYFMMTPDGNGAIGYTVSPPFDIEKKRKSKRLFGKAKNISEIEENWNKGLEKNIRRALLFYPSFKAVVFSDGRGEIRMNPGDIIFEKIIHTPYSLEQRMKISGKALPEKNESGVN